MGWQDRPYYRDQSPSSGNPLLWIFSGSVPLFTAFGIRVRMHATLLLLIVLTLATSGMNGGLGLVNAMTGSVVLFGIILLHEFGHCFAARTVGGEANEIMMWLLGGLAFADAPKRAWPQFVVAAGGPLVNVVICAVTSAGIFLLNLHNPRFHWNPLSPLGAGTVSFYLRWIFSISMGLLLFNLLPIFPLDGGRILQAILWAKLRYYRATMITYIVGMVGSVLLAMYGVTLFSSGFGILIICIAASCFLFCYQQRAQLKAAGPWEFDDDGIDYSAASWQPEIPTRKHKKLSRRAKRKLRKQAEREENEQSRIDAILAKVSAKGMQSLTWGERRALRKATERQRRQEIEVTGDLD